MNPNERPHEFSVSFDYAERDSFRDLAKAMECFSDAFTAYARGSSARLRIVRIRPGSLVCDLEADAAGWDCVQLMASDFQDIQTGSRTLLMPEKARQALFHMLEHSASVKIMLDGAEYGLGNTSASTLNVKATAESGRQTTHTGIVDRVDLKSDSFRIMLPHGYRVACAPALVHLNAITECLDFENRRMRVSGFGRYRSTDFLPSSIKVARVEVLRERPRFSTLLDRLMQGLDPGETNAAIARCAEETEALMEQDLSEAEQSVGEAS